MELERPLTARSAIASLLLGTHPPRLRGALLVRWCERLGIAEGTARVALSRMVEAGEARSSDGHYELTGRLEARQVTQDWSLAPALGRWDGDWLLHIVRAGPRPAASRARLRQAATRARLAELREGVWGRPDNLPAAATAAETAAVLADQTNRWRARPDGDGDGAGPELPTLHGPTVDDPVRDGSAVAVATLFDLAATAARAHELLDRLVRLTGALEAGDADLAEAFVVGAAALQHVRRDPLLPVDLLPDDWPMGALRLAYGRYQRAFEASVQHWFSSATAAAG